MDDLSRLLENKYQRVIYLYNKGYSLNDISKDVEIDPLGIIRYWIKKSRYMRGKRKPTKYTSSIG